MISLPQPSCCRCDVASRAETAELLGRITCQQHIARILHAGGILHDAPLAQQGPGLLREVLAPKAYGAWNLARKLPMLGVMQFVAFSSIASVTGPAGSLSYAGANACLDAQAAELQAAGTPVKQSQHSRCCGAAWRPWCTSVFW